MIGGSVDLCDVDSVTLTIVSPLAAPTTSTGTSKDTYRVNEDVYAAGSGVRTIMIPLPPATTITPEQ